MSHLLKYQPLGICEKVRSRRVTARSTGQEDQDEASQVIADIVASRTGGAR